MMPETLPATLQEFLEQRMQSVSDAARLIIVLDPGGRLSLDETFTHARRTWQVFRYDENDLAFRKAFRLVNRTLVWVTGRFGANEQAVIDVSSLTGIFRQADEIFDCSLSGALSKLVPNETFPLAPILEHANVISNHLDRIAQGVRALRPHMAKGAALDANTVRALVLAALAPQFEPRTFLFQAATPSQVLQSYVVLAWSEDWDERAQELLRVQARTASQLNLDQVTAWLDAPTDAVARFLYLYRFLARARVPNVVNQVRGLGVLGFDPQPLERGLGTVLHLWEQDAAWRKRVIRQAEATLELTDIRSALGLLDLSTPDKIARAASHAEAPALVYELGALVLRVGLESKQIGKALARWQEHSAARQEFAADETRYARCAQAMTTVLDEAQFIVTRMREPLPESQELTALIQWYTDNKFYDLEYAHARALNATNRFADESHREQAAHLLTLLRKEIRKRLDQADHLLAQPIMQHWNGFLTFQRLSPRVLWDFVINAELVPTTDACLWFIVFDGMRYDTWQRIVKPRLAEKFEINQEHAYLSPLPSWTKIARTALVAGRTPEHFRGYRQQTTLDQEQLASVLFKLKEPERAAKLRFYSRMESDRTTSEFDRARRCAYNLLVFNISDDDLHKQRDNVFALNENVKGAVTRALEFLDGLIKPRDTVVISSDHGFVELDSEDAIPIADETRWAREQDPTKPNPVTFRYIRDAETPDGLEDVFTFEYPGLRDGKFTVPIGRKWFKREGSANTDRYAHGGLSFAEMVVPGAMMQLIQTPRIEFTLEDLPAVLQADEGKSLQLAVRVKNRGNQSGAYELAVKTDTDTAFQTMRGTLNPGESAEHSMTTKPFARLDAGKKSFIQLALKYQGANGKTIKPRQREIPVEIRERRDVVEISFGGLDDLDKI